MNRHRIHTAVLLGLLSTCTLAGSAIANEKPRTPRGELVHRIVMKWGNHVQQVHRADVHAWASGMGPLFSRASLQTLRRAAQAHTFEAMNNALLSDDPRARRSASGTGGSAVPGKLLGDSDTDLTYVPVTPCRIIDTRVAAGKIAGGVARHYNLFPKADYTEYGGHNSNCGIGNVSGASVAAVALNMTVVQPEAGGYLTAFPFGAQQPLASTLNYPVGEIRGNFAVVKVGLANGTGSELSIFSFATTHVVADVVGYFIKPEATALQCVNVQDNHALNAGLSVSIETPTCPTDYEMTGGGCDSELPLSTQFFTNRTVNAVNGDVHRCTFRNPTGNTMTVTAYGRCCRTPGR